MNRLGLSSDDKYKIVIDETKKKKLPPYIPSTFSVKFLFQTCLDIRSVVKKVSILELFFFLYFLSDMSGWCRGQDYTACISEKNWVCLILPFCDNANVCIILGYILFLYILL